MALIFARPRLRKSSQPDAATLLWLTLIAGLLPLLHRSYGHYVLQALPPATILAGAGLAGGWQWLEAKVRSSDDMDPRLRGDDGAQFASSPRKVGIPSVVLAIVLIGVIALALIDLPRWPRYLAYTGDLVRTRTAPRRPSSRSRSRASRSWWSPTSPQLYFLSNRQPPTRWQYLLPVNYTPEREAELAT